MIEQASPQIMGHDEECWLAFMKRDIPNYQDRPHRPSDPKNWFKAYRKLKKESDAEMASGAEKLKAAFASIKQEKEQSFARLTSRPSMPVITRRANTGWSTRGHWQPSAKNMSASEKIKRDVQDAQRSRMLRERNQIKLGRQMKSTAMPSNHTKVAVAPRSMIEEIKKRNASPPPQPVPRAIRAPVQRATGSRPPLHAPSTAEKRRPKEAGDGYDLMRDRESRLKAMQTRKFDSSVPEQERDPDDAKGGDAGGLSLDFLEEDDLFSDDNDQPDTTPRKNTTPHRPAHLSPAHSKPAGIAASPAPLYSASPRPLPAKRKAQPSLFMSSPAKKARPGVT